MSGIGSASKWGVDNSKGQDGEKEVRGLTLGAGLLRYMRCAPAKQAAATQSTLMGAGAARVSSLHHGSQSNTA